MEQACHKCGQMVEEGRVFCVHCAAPQIRVVVEEPAESAVVAAAPALREQTPLPPSAGVPILGFAVSWTKALKSCALAALIASVLTLLGLHPLVGIPSAGFLSIVFYRQGQQRFAIRPGAAGRLGAFGGLLYFGFLALVVTVGALFPESRAEMHDQFVQYAQKFAASHPENPQAQQLLAQLQSPDKFVAVLVTGCVMLLVVSLVLGGIGGVLAGLIFGRREAG